MSAHSDAGGGNSLQPSDLGFVSGISSNASAAQDTGEALVRDVRARFTTTRGDESHPRLRDMNEGEHGLTGGVRAGIHRRRRPAQQD
jgi:hypothetical protein